MSQALAWQTTSRSRGLMNSERSQNVCGQRREAERGEEALAVLHHLLRVGVPLLEDLGRGRSRDRRWRRDERVDVVPLLRPHVAEQVGGDGAVRRHDSVAVFLAQAVAHVGVQRDVERPDLVPEAVEFLGELVGRHVVLGAPHGAGVLEAELARALVGELDEAHELLAHGLAMACQPVQASAQFLGVAAVARILLRSSRSRHLSCLVGQYLPFAVGAFQAGGESRDLVGFVGIGRRREGRGRASAASSCAADGRQRDASNWSRFLRVLHRSVDARLVQLGGEGFRVVGDVGRFDPVGAAGIDA